MSLDALLTHTAVPQRKSVTAGIVGGQVPSWSNITTAVACRRQDAKSETKRRYAVDNILVTHTIITEYSGIQVGDRFVDGSTYWIVKGIQRRSEIGSMDTFYVYDCEQVLMRTS